MDVVLMILYCTIVLGILVVIHEGGHYLASRAFGVRVTEFMLGMPGPNIGFKKWGTKFGVTPILLGGYARVCGMEPGEMSPHLESVLAALYRRGTANMEDIAADCGITDDEALEALDELVEWGSCTGPTKKDEYNTYRAMEVIPTKKQIKAAREAGLPEPARYEEGQARPVDDAHALFESEYRQQYRSLPFWKRTVILLAGIAVNLLFAIVVFVVLFGILLQRVFYLQIVKGGDYQESFSLKTEREVSVASTRGNIYDRNGELLAYSELSYSVTIQDNGTYASKTKNPKLNDTIYRLIQLIEKNGDSVVSDLGIVYNNGHYEYSLEGNSLLRLKADVYGKTKISELEPKQELASADELMAYLCGEKKYDIRSSYTEEEQQKYGISVAGYTPEEQLQIAADLKKPVLLHTKGQEKRIAELLRGFPYHICVHWYSGTEQDLEPYLDLGCYFTLGPDFSAACGSAADRRLLRGFSKEEKKQKRSLYQRMLQEIPVERLFIETDGISAVAWTMGEAEAEWNMLPFALQANMQSLAEATGKNEAELQQQLCRNLGRFLQG